MIKEIIKKAIERTFVDLKIEESFDWVVKNNPIERQGLYGEYFTNVAMQTFRKVRVGDGVYLHSAYGLIGANQDEAAEIFAEKLRTDIELSKVISKIEPVLGSGFINFWIKDEILSEKLRGELTGKSNWMEGKRVLVEYSSPNIAKRFSVGHLRSTIIGQALFNLYKASGASVTNDNHLGDWGTQFGMIIAAVEEEKADISNMSIGELEELYVRFNKRVEERPELKDKAREAFLRLEQGDDNARKVWQLAIEVSMKEFEEIYKKLNVSFTNNYGESEYESLMIGIIQELKDKKIATEGEGGAWIIRFEKDGKEYMPVAMLLKSDGTTTYLTRDMATVKLRLDKAELNADLYIYEVGSEQKLHFRQVFDTARRLWPEETKNIDFVHVAHGLLTLPEGKMSTRRGNTIKLEELLERVGEEARSLGKGEEIDFEVMGMNAVKYNELRRSPELNYVFRWEEALAMEGNSAPYINYAYVRAKKITDNSPARPAGGSQMSDGEISFEGEEKELARLLMKFVEGEVVEEAARNFSPNSLASYLFEVAKKFNAFYDHNKVLGDEREKQRLVLVNAVAEVIKNGMKLLGIEVVEKM